MGLSANVEQVFHLAVEAAYRMQDSKLTDEERAMAAESYAFYRQQYNFVNRDNWWEQECATSPNQSECLCYDL